MMSTELQFGKLEQLNPHCSFLKLEQSANQDLSESALEVPLFDFASTHHQIGARLVTIPANRAFARHIHPNAHHFIYVVNGTGVLEYDGARYVLKPGEYCVVCKGVVHKLGAGEDGLLAMIVNSPTYENGDPAHVHYLEDETLVSVEFASNGHTA
jgi:quercetin dioxygenase-like cupin family protein